MAAPDTTAAEVLWLPLNAVLKSDAARPVMFKDGRSIYIDDTGALVFSLNADREELTRQLVQHFATKGWQQRERPSVNPNTATSFPSGWETRCVSDADRLARKPCRTANHSMNGMASGRSCAEPL